MFARIYEGTGKRETLEPESETQLEGSIRVKP